MAISRGQLVKELEPGLNALFGLEYKQYENQHAEIYTLSLHDALPICRSSADITMWPNFG